MGKYYIISLTHTLKEHKFLTIWKPDNADYCMSKESAGEYDEAGKNKHDNALNLPVKIEDANNLFQYIEYEKDRWLHMIPNCQSTWDVLGVRMTRSGLVRKTEVKPQQA